MMSTWIIFPRRSIIKLHHGATSETSSHHYNETLLFPSVTLCPGFGFPGAPEAEQDATPILSQNFEEAEQKLRTVSDLVLDFRHGLPSRWHNNISCFWTSDYYVYTKKFHRIITSKNLNDTTILSSKIIPLMYLDVTRCITYSPPEFPKAAWGGEVTKRATQSC